MNWIDIAILVVWGITALWGYSAGLLQIVVPFISLVVGMALASRVGDEVGNIFSGISDNENAQTVAGFIVVFGALFVAGGIISFMARKVLAIIPLFGLANSLAGMAVGLLVGFLLLSGVLTGIQKFPFRDLDKTIDGDWDNQLEKLNN